MDRQLFTYFRSSAAWRVRIALAHKGLDYSAVPVHLLRDGGQQHAPAYLARNPQGLVPTLIEAGQALSQSLAICEYLEEVYPQPPLLPAAPLARAKVRALACLVACDIHPLNNLRVLQYLKRELGQAQAEIDRWCRHWMDEGLRALEAELAALGSSRFCVGDSVSLADLCLLPQLFNARRYALDLDPYPRLLAVEAHLASLPAFADTHPSRQADAE